MMLTNEQASVLAHTSQTGRYVTRDASVIEMGRAGLLRDHGPQRLAGGDHYLTMTPAGRAALSEWRAAQPKPSKIRRRQSPQFEAWLTYCEVFRRIPLATFVKEVWPRRREYA